MSPGVLNEADSRPYPKQNISFKTRSMLSHWPHTLKGDLVWTGTEFPDEETYTLTLTAEEAMEVEHALNYFNSMRLAPRSP